MYKYSLRTSIISANAHGVKMSAFNFIRRKDCTAARLSSIRPASASIVAIYATITPPYYVSLQRLLFVVRV